MDADLVMLFTLTFVVNLVGSLAYSVRIAGIRTTRIAMSLSLFNLLLLVSRTASSFLAPFLGNRVERTLALGVEQAIGDFRVLLAAASLATVVGALLTPTFQRLFSRAVAGFSVHRSFWRLLLRSATPAGFAELRRSVAVPAQENVTALLSPRERPPTRIVAINVVATAVFTVGVVAPSFAAYLHPDLRMTASNLSGVVNGIATILLYLLVDPYLSVLTDDVLRGKSSEPAFRRCVVWMLGSRLAGTVLAQLLLWPAAAAIAAVATRM